MVRLSNYRELRGSLCVLQALSELPLAIQGEDDTDLLTLNSEI